MVPSTARSRSRRDAKAARRGECSRAMASIEGKGLPPADREMRGRLTGREIAVSAALTAAFIWSYWPILIDMTRKWSDDPQYSHAFLVPAFAAYLLWFRRKFISLSDWHASWWGLPVLAVGISARLVGSIVYFEWLESISLLLVLAGTVILVAGPMAIRWSWPAIAFLGFMIPLPFRVETAFSLPLQRIATLASTYVLQTLGRPAFSEGNVIVMNDVRIGVVEACNGLGMLMLFFALATALAIVVRRHPLEKMLIIASAAPVAVAANVIRITVTGLLSESVDSKTLARIHDWAGWLMMPLALGLLGLEILIVSRLVVKNEPRENLALKGILPVRQPQGLRIKL